MAGNLVITEKWVKEKLNLKIDNLDIVRSLSLPGSFHQKITHLGRSLLTFTRLKHLDLSRNALESLEGLDHLKGLETLNLYYNNVPNLKEVFRLRHNTHLKEIDIRLNPVTQSVPDYRLFIVHMLLHLQLLDDRNVTDEERKTALLYFDTDQAYEFDRSIHKENVSPVKDSTPKTNHIQARLSLTHSIAPLRSGLGKDTEELLELFAEKGDHLFTHSRVPPRHPPSSPPVKRKILRPTAGATTPDKKRKPTEKQSNSSPTDVQKQPGYHFTPNPQPPLTVNTVSTAETAEQQNKDDLNDKGKEIARLREQVKILEGRPDKELLEAAHKDMVELQKQCQALLDENAVLRETWAKSDDARANEEPSTRSTHTNTILSNIAHQQEGIKDTLSQLSQSLSQLLSHSSQLQSVVIMLQESHKSLVSSNRHLVQELADTKLRHSHEVAQLSKNYNTLRSLVQERLHV